MNSGSKPKRILKVKEVLRYAIANKTISLVHRSGSSGSHLINISDSFSLSKIQDNCSIETSPIETELVCLESTLAVESLNDKCVFNDMRTVYFHSDSKALDKKFTLWFIECSKDKIQAVGRERTFFLTQFSEAKIYETEIKFQKNFKALENAAINVKIQYVKNEEALITKIINLFEQKRKLLGILLKRCLDEIKNAHGENSLKTHKKKGSEFGGWYDKNILAA